MKTKKKTSPTKIALIILAVPILLVLNTASVGLFTGFVEGFSEGFSESFKKSFNKSFEEAIQKKQPQPEKNMKTLEKAEKTKKTTDQTEVVSQEEKMKETVLSESNEDGGEILPQIFTVIMSSSVEELKEFVEQNKESVNTFDSLKRTPLMFAIQTKDLEKVKVLLAAGAWISTYDSSGRTPIFYAARSLTKDGLELIVKAGANYDSRLQDGTTPLMTAAQFNHNEDIFQPLIKYEKNINARNNDGLSALHIALANKNHVATTALVEAGADLKNFDKNRATPVMYACMYGTEQTIDFMLKHGANLDDVDKFDNNVLIYAAQENSPQVVEYLLSKEIDVNSKNSLGETPLMYAAGKNAPSVVRTLLEFDADPSIKTNDGKTAIDFAKQNKTEEHAKKIQQMLSDEEATEDEESIEESR